jgi:hypothetical protein
VLLLGLLVGATPAQTEKIDFPRTNQPANFSFAAGSFDNVSVRASPTTVQVEEPITLVVRIKSLVPGPLAHPPQRDKLRLFPDDFEKNFFVEDGEDRYLEDQNIWEFTYRVYPQRMDVKAIPSLEFVYFQIVPERKYQAVASEEIAIEVKARATVELDTPATIRSRMRPPVADNGLLGTGTLDTWLVVLVIAAPPLLCLAGVAAWQRLFPDAATRAHLRRSRAFRQAARQLSRLGPRARAEAVAAVLVRYLRARIDLATAEPTPAEVLRALTKVGVDSEAARSTEHFFRACDAARFTPGGGLPNGLPAEAVAVLQALENALAAGPTAAPEPQRPHDGFFLPGILLVVALTLAAAPASDADLLAAADGHFRQGVAVEHDGTASRKAFAEAAHQYQLLINRGHHHPELFRRLGDASLLAGQLPQAIFAYRRGLERGPHLRALWDHLELARDRVAYPNGQERLPGAEERERPPPGEWPAWLPRPAATVLLLTAAVLHGLAWLALARWWLGRQRSTLVWAAVLLAAAAAVLAAREYSVRRGGYDGRRPFAVVAYNNMALRRGNGTLFPPHADLPTVQRGMEARLLGERGGWVQVEFPGGELGWLPRRAVLLDRPAGG